MAVMSEVSDDPKTPRIQVSAEEAAVAAESSARTIYRWAKAGTIRSSWRRGRRYFDLGDVIEIARLRTRR